jgi:hypothetical protein
VSVELKESPSVRRWFASADYDADPPEEQERRLTLLSDFCREQGKTPEELVSSCLRTTKAGDTAISAKGRVAMNNAIAAFVEQRGLTGLEAVSTGNVIRGFLIHNGVFIQGPAWRG